MMMMKTSWVQRILMRAPTYWKYMREKPRWGIMFLFARVLAARRVERALASAAVRVPVKAPDTIFPSIDLRAAVSSLVRDGCHLGMKLPEGMTKDLQSFAEQNDCFSRDAIANGFLASQYREVNKQRSSDVVAGYYFESVEKCRAIAALRSDAALHHIASAYLGEDAFPVRTRLWWSFPANRVSDRDLHAASQDKFHFDMNDWRTLKFFFYLTPTDKLAGPHEFIPGSHVRRRLKHQLTFTVAHETPELEDYYGAEKIVTITGDAGLGFAEDPFVFHRGTRCRKSPRLMLELEYGVSPPPPSYVYGRLG
jgi:hypothetical protein